MSQEGYESDSPPLYDAGEIEEQRTHRRRPGRPLPSSSQSSSSTTNSRSNRLPPRKSATTSSRRQSFDDYDDTFSLGALIWESCDENPLGWIACALFGTLFVVAMLIVLTARTSIPPCWLPPPRSHDAQQTTTLFANSSSTVNDSPYGMQCSIPKILHLVRPRYVRNREYSFVEWMSVRSAIVWVRPQLIILYSKSEPSGEWWERTKRNTHVKWIRGEERELADGLRAKED